MKMIHLICQTLCPFYPMIFAFVPRWAARERLSFHRLSPVIPTVLPGLEVSACPLRQFFRYCLSACPMLFAFLLLAPKSAASARKQPVSQTQNRPLTRKPHQG